MSRISQYASGDSSHPRQPESSVHVPQGVCAEAELPGMVGPLWRVQALPGQPSREVAADAAPADPSRPPIARAIGGLLQLQAVAVLN